MAAAVEGTPVAPVVDLERVRTAPRAELPAIRGRLAEAAAIADMRIHEPEAAAAAAPPPDPNEGPDLTPEDMARDMKLFMADGTPNIGMVYRLRTRRHNPLPAVKRGKYVRCSLRAYREWKKKEDGRRA
jgi:hypothetical protein